MKASAFRAGVAISDEHDAAMAIDTNMKTKTAMPQAAEQKTIDGKTIAHLFPPPFTGEVPSEHASEAGGAGAPPSPLHHFAVRSAAARHRSERGQAAP